MDKREQFGELFRRDYPAMVRELTLIVGDRSLAEDAAAEGFVELWRRWDRVGTFDRPGAWARRVAIRKAGRARWRRHRGSILEEQAASEGVVGAPESQVDLLRALDQLSQAQRTAVVMHHLSGWPTKDIAEVLGCSDVTVRSHLSRGRQRLAAVLGEDMDDMEVDDVEH